jgi:hypothetical protein
MCAFFRLSIVQDRFLHSVCFTEESSLTTVSDCWHLWKEQFLAEYFFVLHINWNSRWLLSVDLFITQNQLMSLLFVFVVYQQLANTKLRALGKSLSNLASTVKIFLLKRINTTLSDATFNGNAMPINRLIFDLKQQVVNAELLTCWHTLLIGTLIVVSNYKNSFFYILVLFAVIHFFMHEKTIESPDNIKDNWEFRSHGFTN